MTPFNLVHEIDAALESLNRSEKKVAEVILADPQAATRASIAVLAKAAQVSEPTVNRFCKRFNTAGFPDFKLHLAQALASGVPYVTRNVEPDDTAELYTPKIFEATMASLSIAKERLNPSDINLAVDQLIQAKQIAFYGLGACGSVAQDAQHKFFRFNIPVVAYDDVMMQRMVAAATSNNTNGTVKKGLFSWDACALIIEVSFRVSQTFLAHEPKAFLCLLRFLHSKVCVTSENYPRKNQTVREGGTIVCEVLWGEAVQEAGMSVLLGQVSRGLLWADVGEQELRRVEPRVDEERVHDVVGLQHAVQQAYEQELSSQQSAVR